MPREFNILNIIGKFSKQYGNLPDRYIKRASEQVHWKTPRGKPQYLPRTVQRRKFLFTTNRPWTHEFYLENAPGLTVNKVHVEPIKEWSFFRGDRVEVLVGRDKGKQGIVKQIFQERNWITVEGLNTEIKMYGKSNDFEGIPTLKEKPLLVTCQVALVDPSDLQATKIEWRYTESGEKVRVSLRTGRVIPIPASDLETIDYKLPNLYKPSDKDTKKEDVEKITFTPELKTFEMDIMDKMGIKEDRTPQKCYWY